MTLLFALACFAANSLLTRAGLAGGGDAMDFAALRALSAAATLAVLAAALGRPLPLLDRRRWIEAGALLLYLWGFSAAYLSMDAGTGALVLFGTVQAVMFAAALPERPGWRRWAGMGVALSGLSLLAGGAAGAVPVVLMGLAGIGWGIYSLSGRAAGDPLTATAANFVWASAGLVPVALLTGAGGLGAGQWALSLASGIVASGLGYAAWYSVLPRLARTTAALAQLSVPAIALAAAWPLLGEAPGIREGAACLLILGGIAFGLARQRRIGSSGS